MINTTQLSKQFGDLKAVDKISLQIVDNSISDLREQTEPEKYLPSYACRGVKAG